MKKHEILSPQSRAALFDPPTEPAAIVRHYTFSPEDLALIRERRRPANRLGFALHLAYLRFPGRVIGVDETPPADMLAFVSAQIGDNPRRSRNMRTGSKPAERTLANCKPTSTFERSGARITVPLRMSRSSRLREPIVAT
ncbi:hypothetical protein Ms3S1_p11100 (plasmid) [Methylosinus sp. 3S-1]|nr:DUF4158 domain-containing protein [Methylosinus trichosporium]